MFNYFLCYPLLLILKTFNLILIIHLSSKIIITEIKLKLDISNF